MPGVKTTIFISLLGYALAQDANCDYRQDVVPGQNYYVYNSEYPQKYRPGVKCRWIANCPSGYNCRLDCKEVDLPFTQGCTMDRLLISKSGDPQLASAESYCGRGSVSVVSTGQVISVGLISAANSPGGKFLCNLYAQQAKPSPSPTCRCGYKKSNRIVGGDETDVNEFPMMAGVVYVDIAQIKCGGTIISPRAVVTAAHCVVSRTTGDLAIVVGEHNVDTGDSPATKGYAVASIIIHPNYKTNVYDYDVAILVPRNNIQFSDLVGPACLPFKFTNYDFKGQFMTALGWGTLFPGGPTSNVLRKVDLQVIDQPTCQKYYSDVNQRQICTYTTGKDACQDDSGGPLLYTDRSTGLLFHTGIISEGRYCASRNPGINTRITQVLQWITRAAPPYDYCVK